MKRWAMIIGLVACTSGGGQAKDAGHGTDTDPSSASDALLGILVQPERIVLPTGGEVRLTATGLLADRSSTDLTAVVDWSMSAPGVASVSNDLDREGLLTAVSTGTTEVVATLDEISSVPAEVLVTDATLDALAIQPGNITLASGQTLQLEARAAFSDGVTSDATGSVRWITQDPAIAVLDGDGHLEAVGLGQTQVVARWDEVSSPPVTVTVSASAAPDLVISTFQAVPSESDLALVTVEVTNEGDAPASEVWLDLFQDSSTPPRLGDLGADWEDIGLLAPGDSRLLTFERFVSGEEATFWVIVDTEDLVVESNETNNVATTTVTMESTSTLGPDLVVYDVAWVVNDDEITYELEVANFGDDPTGTFTVDVFVDEDTEPGWFDLPDDSATASLTGWNTTVVTLTVPHACSSTCTSWVLLDPYEDVDETDESNNAGGPYEISVSTPPYGDTGWDTSVAW